MPKTRPLVPVKHGSDGLAQCGADRDPAAGLVGERARIGGVGQSALGRGVALAREPQLGRRLTTPLAREPALFPA